MKLKGWLLGLALLWPSFCVHAAYDVESYQEYGKRIKAAQNVSPLGSDLFGEQISLYNGQGEFAVTDIDLPGNNALPVRLGRRFKVESRKQMGYLGGFGVWDVDVPHIQAVVQANIGWTTSSGGRCSSALPPNTTSGWFTQAEIWTGTYMHIPGEGDRELLKNDSPKRQVVSDGQAYPWTTKDFYQLRCLPATVNGYAGEGFVALSPNGLKYFFNYGYQVSAPTLGSFQQLNGVPRRRVYLLATRVEDRFGNYVTYSYSGGLLTSISASDGRQITLANAAGHITQAQAAGHTWTYQYNGTALTAVVRPDGSTWGYQTVNADGYTLTPYYDPPFPYEEERPDCPEPSLGYGSLVLRITHPSGAVGEFSFGYMRHYRDGTPTYCTVRAIGDQYLWVPNFFDSYSLLQKTVTGPGISQQQWTYNYEGYPADFVMAPGSCLGCSSVKSVTVQGPSGEKDIYRFGLSYGTNEGHLLGQDRQNMSGTVLRSVSNTYVDDAAAASMPFPDTYGLSYLSDIDSTANRVRPVSSVVIAQDGATFASTVSAFDVFARPTTTSKSSSLGYSRTEVVERSNNLSNWVIGQVAKVTCTAPAECKPGYAPNGIVTSQTDYDTLSRPIRKFAFGKLQETLTYNSDGTIATVSDGRDGVAGAETTISLSAWKRGVPQTIGFPITPDAPAGSSRSVVVNDDGTVASVTDENGYLTSYGYDAMGRLASIGYPTGDSTMWNSTSIAFEKQTTAAYGLPAGYWRRWERTGNRWAFTYYDAFWRPVVQEVYDSSSVTATLSQKITRYDEEGRVIYESYPSAAVTTYQQALPGVVTTYDALGRVTQLKQDSELGQLTTSTAYVAGFKAQVTNPRGFQTTTEFQVFDQPETSVPSGITRSAGPDTQAVEIQRDIFGKPKRLTQRNADGSLRADRFFVYDAYQQLCKTIEPESSTTVMDYDAAGNLQWSAAGLSLADVNSCDTIAGRDSGRKVTRYYDARNRLTSLEFPDGRGNQSWQYALDGLPTQITTYNDPNNGLPVVNTYSYNKRRLLSGESVSQPGWYTWNLGYNYDANGALQGQSYPTGLYLDYAPNALGQATKAGTYATGVSYYPNGGIKQFTYGNGIVHTMTQNARQLPARTTDAGVLDFDNRFDANGNSTDTYDLALGSVYNLHRYYDGLDRLVSAGSWKFGGDGWHYFTYDALDNIKSWKLAGVKDYANYYYDPATNRLTNIQNSSGASVVGLGYDVQGNLQNKNGQNYSFDYGNRLREVTGKEYYRYDAHGRRVLAWSPTQGSIFSQYGQNGQMLYQDDQRKQKTLEHVYLAGSLVAIREKSLATGIYATKYQHTDALGSPVAVSDQSAQVIVRTQWEPYGAAINKTVDGVGYTGHVMDAATGLTYMQQRYYDPQVGRFLGIDPVFADPTNGANFNRYKYGANNPYRFADPDGRQEKEEEARVTSMAGHPGIGGAPISGVPGKGMPESAGKTQGSGGGNPNSVFLPQNVSYALSVVFGQDVSGVHILENAKLAEEYGATATTGPNAIYLRGSLDDFLSSPKTVLEEYYHVLVQWNTDDASLGGYVYESAKAWLSGGDSYYDNRFEAAAKAYANDKQNVERYNYQRTEGYKWRQVYDQNH